MSDHQTRPWETTHGQSGTKLHRCWKNIKARCNNPSSERYPHYGGRGITYQEDWEYFSNFYKWAMGNGYEEGLTIDRRDPDLNYCEDNCRWITYEQNHDEMMAHNLANGTGIFSEKSKQLSKEGLRDSLGKPTYLLKDGEEILFGSRGELVEFLAGCLDRGRASVKSQVTMCLSGKCKTIAGFLIYEK